VVILKGAASLVAEPAGRITINLTGTALMATAGSGDVLTGCVGAFLAQGMEAGRSAIAAAYLHGLAGEILARDLGDAGLLSGELADALPIARHSLRGESEGRSREAGAGWRARR
jgi:NAD(P)H-hydrate epimerase